MTGRDASEAGTLRAGVAKVDITTGESDAKIMDPLYAKVLVLDDGQTRAAIIAMDTTAIGGRAVSQRILDDVGEEFLPALRGRVESELGVPGANVLVNASHTHPPGRLLCSDEEQIERAFDAVRRAVEGLAPVRIGAGSGHEDRLTVNRILELKNGRQWTVRHSYPCPPDEEVAGLGPMDPEIGILRVDRLDGTPLAVVYNFAFHPLFGDTQGAITANIPGVASKVIEESVGHDAMALFLQGAGGNMIDVYFKDFGRPRDVEPLGIMLGESTLEAWREIETSDVDVSVMSETIELPRRTDVPERVAELRQEQTELLASLRGITLNFKAFIPLYMQYTLNDACPADYAFQYLKAESIGSDARAGMDRVNRGLVDKYLAGVRAMERLSVIEDDIATLLKHEAVNKASGSPTIPAEVQGIRIGDCVLISSPAELLVEIGLNLKAVSSHAHTFVVPFSNGYMHYGPPAGHYGRGSYEVTECLLAPEWQALYEGKATEIMAKV